MTIHSKLLAGITVFILLGGIFFSEAMGWWQTESTKEAATFTSGEFAGQANPEDIRGSYTFGDVERNFDIPASILAQAFGVDNELPADFPVKSLEELYAASPVEIGTSSVRLFVAFYLGMPYDLSNDVYLPEQATALLRERNLNNEQIAYLEAHTLVNSTDNNEGGGTNFPTSDSPLPTSTNTADSTVDESNSITINGKTTFGELLSWGMSPNAIEAILGTTLPSSTGMTIKDFCVENGLSFETIREALEIEVHKLY
jgi:hypothetical protein